MNFVIIISDTLRWDHLGASGNSWIRTPNLDRLAAESLVFTRAYTGSFPTIPHRTDLMTGKWVYPYRGWSPLPKDEPILSQTLTDAGYVTMMINDTPHLVRDGHCFDRGFQAWKWNRGQEGDRAITDNIPVGLPCAPEKIRGPERMRTNHYRWRTRHWETERDTF
ncbi:MAG: sulfatase-like hydrolase/transferase, partial [Candidatus Sumerlaeota bacterium]|nr:sulfatase-like hydrolase/transferase [Candidatus Sumerlaeota bacterium]